MQRSPGLVEWFIINLKIGGLSFGGSGRVLLYHDVVVRQRAWLDDDEFQALFTLAQVLPGSNAVNVSAYLGYRLAGPAAALLGVVAMALPGPLLAVSAFTLVDPGAPAVVTLFQGFALGSAALFLVLAGRLYQGMMGSLGMTGNTAPGAAGRRQTAASRPRALRRLAIAALVALASCVGLPLYAIIGTGVAAGLVVEFWP